MLSNCMSFPDTSFQWMCTGPCTSLKAVAERADLTELAGPFLSSTARMLTAIPGLSTEAFTFDAVKLPESILLWLCVFFHWTNTWKCRECFLDTCLLEGMGQTKDPAVVPGRWRIVVRNEAGLHEAGSLQTALWMLAFSSGILTCLRFTLQPHLHQARRSTTKGEWKRYI